MFRAADYSPSSG